MRIDYLIMARALLPPVDESSSKRRFSFRYTSIGMISHAVKTQGVCNIEERGERRRELTDLAWYSGALYQGIFFHRWSQTQWLELFFIRHTLPPYPSFILRQRTSFIDLFRHLRSHPYSWQVSDLSSHGRRKHLSKSWRGNKVVWQVRCNRLLQHHWIQSRFGSKSVIYWKASIDPCISLQSRPWKSWVLPVHTEGLPWLC